MKRPHVTCYLNVSAEGHIDGEFMKAEASEKATAVFRQRWLDMEPDAVIYGSSTMALFRAAGLKILCPRRKSILKERISKRPAISGGIMSPLTQGAALPMKAIPLTKRAGGLTASYTL